MLEILTHSFIFGWLGSNAKDAVSSFITNLCPGHCVLSLSGRVSVRGYPWNIVERVKTQRSESGCALYWKCLRREWRFWGKIESTLVLDLNSLSLSLVEYISLKYASYLNLFPPYKTSWSTRLRQRPNKVGGKYLANSKELCQCEVGNIVVMLIAFPELSDLMRTIWAPSHWDPIIPEPKQKWVQAGWCQMGGRDRDLET